MFAGLLVTAGCAWMPGVGTEAGADGQADRQEEVRQQQQADSEQQQQEEGAEETGQAAETDSAGAEAGGEETETAEAGAAMTVQETGKRQKDRPVEISTWVPVSRFKFSYTDPKASFPSVNRVVEEPVQLGVTEKGYTAPDQVEEGNTESVELTQEFPEKTQFTARAIRVISARLLRRLKERGYMGVLVSPHPGDITKDGTDRRPEGESSLRIVFHVARVSEVRTVARGDRLVGKENEQIVNHPAHEWIRSQSPVEGGKGKEMERGKLTDYVNRLNRHPGRRVDLSVSGGDEEGQSVLDYRVSENKPWTAYLQVANTGTESSGEVQTTLGVVHNQLTGRDDIFSISYVASGLDDEFQRVDDDSDENLGDISPDFQAGTVSYDTPLLGPGSRTRLELVGQWDKFTSEDVGLRGVDFVGEGWAVGGTLSHNILQWDDYFVDAYAGVTGKRETVDNQPAQITARESFVIPEVGFEGETSSQTTNSSWKLGFEWNQDDLAGTDQAEINRLGRIADPSWEKFTFDASHSMYLEPLLFESWKDPSTPGTSTLAHELKLGARGQYSEDRLNSNELLIGGGMYTVRGYPESAVSGDSGYTVNLDYRLHVPRLFPVEAEPATIPLTNTDFRRAPENVFGMPDWDWVLKGFVDYGYVDNTNRISGVEADETLTSVGVGTEVQLLSYLRFRADWGFAMRDLDGPNSPDVESGDSEAHFLFTLTY